MKRAPGEGKVNATKTFTPPRFRFPAAHACPVLPFLAAAWSFPAWLSSRLKKPFFEMVKSPHSKTKPALGATGLRGPMAVGTQQKYRVMFILLIWFPFRYRPCRPKNPAGDSRPRRRCPVPAACKSRMSSAHRHDAATFALQEHRCYFA